MWLLARCQTMMLIAMSVMMIVMRFAETLFTMEHEEVHAEGIERRNKHACQHREICKAATCDMRRVNRLDDAVLGIKAGEERRSNQGQRSQQASNPGDGHVFAQSTHVADVLIVMHADDHSTRSKEEQRFEERMRHQVKHGD